MTFGLFDLQVNGLVPAAQESDLRRRLQTPNSGTRANTERYEGVHVDLFHDLARDPSLLGADLIHPSERGHAHVATRALQALASWIDGSI